MKYCYNSLLALSLLVLPLGACKEIRQPEPQPVCVNVKEVKAVEDVSLRSYVGKIEPSKNVVVTSPIPGKLKTLQVKKGQNVREGQVIAVIGSESVVSAYDMAKATLEQAQDGYQRMMQMYSKGGVTEVQKMDITTQLRKAESAFKAAEDALGKCSVRAPYSGIVEQVYVEEGLELGLSAPLVRILNARNVEISIHVPENEIRSIATGDTAIVEVPAADAILEARVSSKGADASPVSHTYDCTLVPDRDNPDVLPGMVCKVRMKTGMGSRIVIPVRCLLSDNNGRYLWCSSPDGVISKRYVVSEGFADDGVIVSSGLEEGDLVVVDGFRKVSSGMKVRIKVL